ncbi:MAG: dUTP diphosphatase [Acholeplasmataceae bacterium]|nr:dUTP diphosphatase [Acholeplasmataceae bacterium]
MRKFEIAKGYETQHVIIPKRATNKSAGYDLSSIEDVVIKPQQIKLVKTGLKAMMPNDEALFIFPRSSLAIKKGLVMSNSVGVVDADYYGNPDNDGLIMVPLMNILDHDVIVQKGDRIAQGIFLKYEVTSDDEPTNATRMGGFGSSGHKPL